MSRLVFTVSRSTLVPALVPALALTFALGCGDGASSSPDAAAGADAADAAAGLDAAPPTAGCTCLALGVDYMNGTGTAARLDLPARTLTEDAVPGGVSGDPVVRQAGGGLAIVNRFGADNVTWLDPDTLEVRAQVSAGKGANPQDAAFAADRMFAPLFGRAEVATWDLATSPPTPGTADDLATHDPDGNPNAASALILGDWLAVTIGLLDDEDPFLAAKGRGRVLVRAVGGGAWTSLELTYANPVGFLRAAGPTTAFVPTAPTFSAADGCIERVDLGPTPTVLTCLVENSALGGFATGVAPTGDGGAYVAVSDAEYAGSIHRVDASGVVSASLVPATLSPTDLAFCEATGQLVFNDSITGGLFVLDVATGTLASPDPLDVGLPSAYGNGLACW